MRKLFIIPKYHNNVSKTLLWIGRVLTSIFCCVIIGEITRVILELQLYLVLQTLVGFLYFFLIIGLILLLVLTFFFLAFKKEQMGGLALTPGGILWGAIAIYLLIKYDSTFATWRSWFYTFEPLFSGLFLILAWYTEHKWASSKSIYEEMQKKQQQNNIKFCSKCGTKTIKDTEFCGECGSSPSTPSIQKIEGG